MAFETKRERLIYFGFVPIIAACAGALATALFSGQACSPGSETLVTIMTNSSLSGPEKLKALQIYQDLADKPWALVRSLTMLLYAALGLFGVAIAQRIQGS